MRTSARRVSRFLAGALVAAPLLLVLLHAPPAKKAAARAALALLERALGGSAAFQVFDYRLWRGELWVEGLSWISEGAELRAREVRFGLSLRGPLEIRVREPDVRIALSGPAGGKPIALPQVALGSFIAIENGALHLEWPRESRSLQLSSIEASLRPEGAFSRATFETGSGRLRDGEAELELGPARALLRLGRAEVEIDEARLSKNASFIAASGRVGPFSPLIGEIRVEHSIDLALLSTFDPRIALEGVLDGEGTLRLRPSGNEGEGVVRAGAVSASSLGPFAAEVSWRLQDEELRADVFFESLESARFAPLASGVSGRVGLSLENLDFENARGEGLVSLRERGGLSGIPLEGDIQFRLESQEIAFTAEELTVPGAELAASGTIGTAVEARYRARIEDLATLAVPLGGPLAVEGTVAGPLRDPIVEARIESAGVSLGRSTFEVEGRAAYGNARVEVHELTLRGREAEIVLDGSFPTTSRAGDLDVNARIANLPLRALAEEISSGRLDALLTGRGELSRPTIEATFTASDIATANGLRADVRAEARSQGFSGEAEIRVERVSLRGKALPGATIAAKSDGSTARFWTRLDDGLEILSGEVLLRPPYSLEAEIPLENFPFGTIREISPALAEAEMELEASGVARLQSSLKELDDVHYRVDAERVLAVYRGIALGATSPFTIEGARAGFSVSDLTLVGEDTAIGIDGVVPLSRDGSVVVHARGASRLELLRPWFPDLDPEGRANVDVRIEGALPDPWLRGELSLEEASARFGGISIENVEARAAWSDRALAVESLTGNALGGSFRVAGELPPQLDAGAPSRLQFEARELDPLRLVPGEKPEFLEEAELRIAVAGDLQGKGTDLSRWQGTGTIESVRFAMRGLDTRSESPGSWRFENGRLLVSNLRIASRETRLTLDGEVQPFPAPLSWSVRASGRVDHELSRVFLEDLGLSLAGATDLDLRMEKHGDQPLDLAGRGEFTHARLLVREPAIAFTNASGEIALSPGTISLTRLSADAGGGKVEAEGFFSLEGGSLREVDLGGKSRSVRLNYPEGLRSEVNGDLRLRGHPDRLRLTGDVELARALLSRDISVESEILQSLSRVSAAAAPSPFASRVDLDLRVRASEAFRVDNNLARMEASVNLTVLGSLATPEIDGIASVRPGGRFRFGGNEYRIETGRILLEGYPGAPAELDITARTSVGPYDIRLVLRGPTDGLSTELNSDSHPDLSQGDVASLLLTGRTLSEISSASRDVVSQSVVSYLGATLADLAKLGIGEALPFEILTLEPSLIAGEADPGARFTLGARFDNSLSLVYSIGLDNAEDQIWVIDYELPRRLRTQIVRDEDNEYALGISQEVRFDVRHRERSKPPREAISELRVVFEGDAWGLADEVRGFFDVKSGARFDYWEIWDRAEKARRELRSRGYLEAVVNVATTPQENGGVGVEYRVIFGPKVRFQFPADGPEGSLKGALEDAWTAEASESILAADLANLATGWLFADGYFTASAEVATERTERELLVNVFLERGPRGKRILVEVEGNEAVPDSYLLASLPKTRSREFHDLLSSKRSQLKQVLALRYATLGYLRADIGDPVTALDERTGDLRVTIPVTEGRQILVGEVELPGVAPADEEALRSRLSLRKGEPFGIERFVQDRSAVASFYRERGFVDVEVEAQVEEREDAPELDVRLAVRPGAQAVVGDVEVQGNEATRESVIRREVKLTPGAPLSASALRETEKGLYDLGIFQSAEVEVEEPPGLLSEPSSRAVRVGVIESPDLELDYGGRATTDGFFEVVTELRAPNVFGRAQHAALRALVGNDRRIFRFSYHSPYLSRYKLDSDFFVEWSDEHGGEAPLDFTDRIWTFTAQQTRPVTEAIDVQWAYTFRRSRTAFGEGFDFEGTPTRRSFVTGSIIGDHRDNLLRPRRGTLWLLTAQIAPELLGSDVRYAKAFGQLFTYVPLAEGVVWASGYRIGAANGFGRPLRLEDGFRAGGPNSVRGFAQDSLGPRDPVLLPLGGGGLVVLNQEIRLPLLWRLRAAGFWDAGNAFETTSDIRLSELRQSLGAGLRLDLPFGVLRLDWAAVVNPLPGEKPWRLIFSLGEAF
jgi:outer membrane protein assembly complex protein YaeT